MKTSIILITALIGMFFNACQSKESTVYHQSDDQAPKFQEDSFKGKIPKNLKSEMNKFLFNPDKHSLSDVDQFYKENAVENQNKDYSQNMKNITFFILAKKFNLPENGSLEMLKYYAHEMANIPYLNKTSSKIYADVLKSLKKEWGNEKIARMAKERVEKTNAYIKENFTEKDRVLNEAKEAHASLMNLNK